MPKNNNLEPVKLPMTLRFGEKPVTKFKNNLDAIKVTLMQAPTMDDLRKYLPAFANATWSDLPDDFDNIDIVEKDNIIRDVFLGKTLPTALETINLSNENHKDDCDKDAYTGGCVRQNHFEH